MTNVIETHLRRLFPDGEDRQTLTNYLANTALRPEIKQPFGVIVQGRQGIGKTLLARWVAHVVGREHSAEISTWLRPASRFYGWLDECRFAYGDLPDNAGLDPLKAAIASDYVTAERKGRDSVSAPARANFLLVSSRFDPIRPEVVGRRFTVLRSPAHPEGFPAGYFNRLVANGQADFEEFIRNV